jgi:hypothetical protein
MVYFSPVEKKGIFVSRSLLYTTYFSGYDIDGAVAKRPILVSFP